MLKLGEFELVRTCVNCWKQDRTNIADAVTVTQISEFECRCRTPHIIEAVVRIRQQNPGFVVIPIEFL